MFLGILCENPGKGELSLYPKDGSVVYSVKESKMNRISIESKFVSNEILFELKRAEELKINKELHTLSDGKSDKNRKFDL